MAGNQQQQLSPVERAQTLPADWDDLVRLDPGAEYTHTAHWLNSVCKCYRESEPLVLTVRREGHLIAGLSAVMHKTRLLKRLDSSLEGTTGGPLLDSDLDREARERLFLLLTRTFGSLRQGPLTALGMALNAGAEESFGPLLRQESGWARQELATAVVSLAGGIADVEKNKLVNNKRNERNRGLRRGAEVFTTRDPKWLARYYPLYLRAARHWGVRPVPEALLRELLAGAQGPGLAGDVFFTCATLEGKVIGGHLNLHLGDRVFAWNGVTDPAFARTHFPATLCVWGDLQEACRRGARWLDLGASDVAASLLSFKKFFGAELEMRGHYTCEGGGVRLARAVRRGVAGWKSRPHDRRFHDELRGKP